MSYRNITVNEKQYKYVVGRTHLKVHGYPAVRKENLILETEHIPPYSEDELSERPWLANLNEDSLDYRDPAYITVTPADVKRYIQGYCQ